MKKKIKRYKIFRCDVNLCNTNTSLPHIHTFTHVALHTHTIINLLVVIPIYIYIYIYKCLCTVKFAFNTPGSMCLGYCHAVTNHD